jgi:hypothetical protein
LEEQRIRNRAAYIQHDNCNGKRPEPLRLPDRYKKEELQNAFERVGGAAFLLRTRWIREVAPIPAPK